MSVYFFALLVQLLVLIELLIVGILNILLINRGSQVLTIGVDFGTGMMMVIVMVLLCLLVSVGVVGRIIIFCSRGQLSAFEGRSYVDRGIIEKS